MVVIRDFFMNHMLSERAERYAWLKANHFEYMLDMYNGHLFIYNDHEGMLYTIRWGES